MATCEGKTGLNIDILYSNRIVTACLKYPNRMFTDTLIEQSRHNLDLEHNGTQLGTIGA